MADNNLLGFSHRAVEFAQDVALLVQQSNLYNVVKATLLGISGHGSGLKLDAQI